MGFTQRENSKNEKVIQAAIREVREETGISELIPVKATYCYLSYF